MEKKNGFTILEMMIVMLIVALLLLITLPNIQQKEKIIRNKGCEALLEIKYDTCYWHDIGIK